MRTTIRPSAALAPFVRVFTIVETDEAMTRTLVPETGLVVGFRFAGSAHEVGEARLPDATIAGMRRVARRMCTSAGGGVVLAMLEPGAAPAFFAEPMHELFGASIDLGDIARPARVAQVREQIALAPSHAARVAAFESFLLSRIEPERTDRIVREAVCAIREGRPQLRMGELAARYGLSRDRFEKRFRRSVGATPKQLASIVRVQRAIALHRRGVGLARLALDAGFYDQAHFGHEIRAVAGEAPQRFFDEEGFC